MHPLMARVLELRQLNNAGQLFALSDYDVITDLVSLLFFPVSGDPPDYYWTWANWLLFLTGVTLFVCTDHRLMDELRDHQRHLQATET